jgi:hypothetical protein
MVSGFVKDYKIWKYHGETDTPPLTNNPLDEIIQDEEFDRMIQSYFDGGGDDDGDDDDDDGVADDDGVGGFQDDDVDGPMDGDSSGDELDDGNFLSQLLRHTEVEVLVASARGFANFEMVRKSVEENIYDLQQQMVGMQHLVLGQASPACAQSSAASTTAQQYPMDTIMSITPYLLLYPVSRAGKTHN